MLPKLTTSEPKIEPQTLPKTEEKYEEVECHKRINFVWSSEESDDEEELDHTNMDGTSRTETVEEELFEDEESQESETENAPELTMENVRAKKSRKKNRKKNVSRPSASVQKDVGRTKLKSQGKEKKHSEKEKESNEKSYDFSKILQIKEEPTPLRKPDHEQKSQKEQERQDEIPEIFQRRMTKSWFPNNVPMEASAIVKDLTGKLETADALTTRDIAALLLEIQSHLGMSTPVLDGLVDSLKKLSHCQTTAIKHVAVKTMIELGESRDDVIVQLVELLSDPAKLIRDEARNGLQCLAGIDDFESLRSAMQDLNLLKDESEQTFSNDMEIVEKLKMRKTKLVESIDNDKHEHLGQDLLVNWLRNAKQSNTGHRDNRDLNDDTTATYEDLEASYFENGRESRSEEMENRNSDVERRNDRTENRHDKMENRNDKMEDRNEKTGNRNGRLENRNYKIENRNDKIENKNDKMENRNDKMEKRKDEAKQMHHGMERRSDKMEYGRNNGNHTTDVLVESHGNYIPIMITENIAASIAPKLFQKFEQYQMASRNEPSKEDVQVDSVDVTSCTALNIDDFLNNLYSGIGSTNAGKDSNKRTAIKDGAEDNKERTRNEKTQNKKKQEKKKHVEKLSDEMKQKNHILSLLFEVSMYALMMERTASNDDRKVLNEQTLKGLTALIKVVKRDDIDIPRVADQAMLFINDLKRQLKAARMVSMQLASKELPSQLANDIVYDYSKVHHQRLIHSPIRRSMVRGIRGERIAKSIEIAQHFKNNNPEKMERRIFGIPERLGCYAAEDGGACKFGKMTMSWTTKAPSYDMDLSLLNEQRIRPLKLQRRHVFNDKTSLARKHMQRLILPSLVKKRMGVNMDILSRKSKRLSLLASTKASKTGVVKLPLLGRGTDPRSHRSNSSMSLNSDFYEHSNSNGPAIEPPPPPNTAELL